MKLRLIESGIGSGCSYRSGSVPSWAPCEVRDVDDETAAYLLGAFPGIFVIVEQPVTKAVVKAPPLKRVVAARKRTAKAKK